MFSLLSIMRKVGNNIQNTKKGEQLALRIDVNKTIDYKGGRNRRILRVKMGLGQRSWSWRQGEPSRWAPMLKAVGVPKVLGPKSLEGKINQAWR